MLTFVVLEIGITPGKETTAASYLASIGPLAGANYSSATDLVCNTNHSLNTSMSG
jgi:hypothetical protein